MSTDHRNSQEVNPSMEQRPEQMSSWTDQEMVEAFNRETTTLAWGYARQIYLLALIKMFQLKKIGISAIANEDGFFLKYKVQLIDENGQRSLKIRKDMHGKLHPFVRVL